MGCGAASSGYSDLSLYLRGLSEFLNLFKNLLTLRKTSLAIQESSVTAFMWVADTLIKPCRKSIQGTRERWDRGARFLDEVAAELDASVGEFRAGRDYLTIASQLLEVSNGFRKPEGGTT